MYYKVRFHLGAGQHFKHWQVSIMRGGKLSDTVYFNPDEYQLILFDCKLINRPSTAKSVFESQKRDVCGWIRCENLDVIDLFDGESMDIGGLPRLEFDPKLIPYWHHTNSSDSLDNYKFDRIITSGKKVYDYSSVVCCT
jgi:hypothetical protein